jgi:hypothetical protein
MKTNIQSQAEYQVIEFPQTLTRPQLHVVDTELMLHLATECQHLLSKGSNRQVVAYSHFKTGKLSLTTVYQMVKTGIPGKIAGMNKIEKMQDYSERLAALKHLFAAVKVFTFGAMAHEKPITRIEDVTCYVIAEVMLREMNTRAYWTK